MGKSKTPYSLPWIFKIFLHFSNRKEVDSQKMKPITFVELHWYFDLLPEKVRVIWCSTCHIQSQSQPLQAINLWWDTLFCDILHGMIRYLSNLEHLLHLVAHMEKRDISVWCCSVHPELDQLLTLGQNSLFVCWHSGGKMCKACESNYFFRFNNYIHPPTHTPPYTHPPPTPPHTTPHKHTQKQTYVSWSK